MTDKQNSLPLARRLESWCSKEHVDMELNVEPVCVHDFEEKAKQKLPIDYFRYYRAGADNEETLKDNLKAFKRIRLRPRMLRGVNEVDMATTILGQRISIPICVSPTGIHRLATPDGEKATARACTRSGTCMAVSMAAGFSLQDIAKASGKGLRWLQLNIIENKSWLEKLIHQAEQNGFTALVVTVDQPIVGNKLSFTKHKKTNKFFEVPYPMFTGRNEVVRFSLSFDKSATWKTITWFKSVSKLPIVVKGILTAEDAKLAVQHGADAILVSNHGGRQLDGVLATIDALPEVIAAVNGHVEVYLDGGVRLGTDILKALALGARAVFVGRPVLWGLAYQVVLV